MARKQLSLTDIPAVGDVRSSTLQERGYTTVADVADATVEELADVSSISPSVARCIRQGAKELRGDADTIHAQIASECGGTRADIAEAFDSFAYRGGSFDTKKEALYEIFCRTNDEAILHLDDQPLHLLYLFFEAGYRDCQSVVDAALDELAEINYIDRSKAKQVQQAAAEALSDSGHASGTSVRERAEALLKQSVGPDAEFRRQQWEAIDQLVNENGRLLLVQRTGWGKSSVYFIATRLLRERGEGPTLIISPLLSLMRNQIQDAQQGLDLEAVTINSNNTDAWEEAKQAVLEGSCDLLLISPERLANPDFREGVLKEMDQGFGMLVIDEAHCISDWGHDFRPDYRRIKRIVQRLPDNIPVAATTATANDRVVDDVTTQLPELEPLRGSLMRDSLRIQAIELGSRERRLAWLAENVTETPYAGVIYCLTKNDVEEVSDWLNEQGLSVLPYHGSLDGAAREEREQLLMDNEIDALVATNALGMGFNKPDLGFVIHFQRPPNLIRYYQEIGRAGRNLEEAYAILLSGEEDDDIAEYFIETAFPEPADFDRVLSTIEESNHPVSLNEIARRIDIRWGMLEKTLDILQVEGAIAREENGYIRTANSWSYDYERVEAVTAQRWRELERIQEFVATDECLMLFINDELDGELEEPCGQCANCTSDFLADSVDDDCLVEKAVEHYRNDSWNVIEPRKMIHTEDGGREYIDEDHQMETGRSLSIWDDPGWGREVRVGKYEEGEFSDELVDAAAQFITETWEPEQAPEWITAVPSTSTEGLIADFATRLARELGIPYEASIAKVAETEPQKSMENSYQKCYNVQDAFDTTGDVKDGPVLLVDDVVASKWTLTEVSKELRKEGSGPVYPFALAERRGE